MGTTRILKKPSSTLKVKRLESTIIQKSLWVIKPNGLNRWWLNELGSCRARLVS